MKKLFVCMAMLCCAMGVSAQEEEVTTYSVYDVNHDNIITVEDIAKVVNRAKTDEANNDPQVVEAEVVNTVIQNIYTQMTKVEELNELKAYMEARLAELTTDINNVKNDLMNNIVNLATLQSKVDLTEVNIAEIDARVSSNDAKLANIEEKMQMMEDKIAMTETKAQDMSQELQAKLDMLNDYIAKTKASVDSNKMEIDATKAMMQDGQDELNVKVDMNKNSIASVEMKADAAQAMAAQANDKADKNADMIDKLRTTLQQILSRLQ